MPAVKSIIIIRGVSSDHIMVVVDAPNPVWPYGGDLCLKFEAAQNTGETYCSRIWPNITPEVISR